MGLERVEKRDSLSPEERGGESRLSFWLSVTRQPERRIQVEMPNRGRIHNCRAT